MNIYIRKSNQSDLHEVYELNKKCRDGTLTWIKLVNLLLRYLWTHFRTLPIWQYSSPIFGFSVPPKNCTQLGSNQTFKSSEFGKIYYQIDTVLLQIFNVHLSLSRQRLCHPPKYSLESRVTHLEPSK